MQVSVKTKVARMLLELGESFAQLKGCSHFRSEVALDAVGFYRSCGYTSVQGVPMTRTSISMQKSLK